MQLRKSSGADIAMGNQKSNGRKMHWKEKTERDGEGFQANIG